MRELQTTVVLLGVLSACATDHVGRADGSGGPPSAVAERPDADPDGTGGGEPLGLAFAPMYSAYDGVHTFVLPVRVEGASGALSVSTEPADFVSWEPSDVGVTLTMRQAGSARVTVVDAQGRRATTTLSVTEATPDEWSLGEDRYYNDFDYETGTLALGRISSCHECHGKDHSDRLVTPGTRIDPTNQMFVPTPQQLGGYSDEALIATFGTGQKLQGSPFRALSLGSLRATPEQMQEILIQVFRNFHTRSPDVQSQRSIVVFLRSLPPQAQPPLDFGGLTSP